MKSLKSAQVFPFYAIAAIILYTIIVWKIATMDFERWNVSSPGSGNNPLCAERRLEEANQNWMRGVAAREKQEVIGPLDTTNQWSWKNGVTFWDFFYPTFDCPHTTERIGKVGDGGKWICGINHIAKKPGPCIVYSFGVNYETSFEEMMLERTHCTVYMFDHTVAPENVTMLKKYGNRASIEKLGLLDKETPNHPYKTLKSHMLKNGHDFIDVLKIDIEGGELKVFENLGRDFPFGLPFGQLAVEIHLPVKPSPDFYKTYKNWMVNLEVMGLRAFRNELNIFATRSFPPILCEYSFINVQVDHWLLHSDPTTSII